MEPLSWVLALLAVLLAAPIISRRFTRITIFEYQRGLRYRNGHYVGLLEPGRHWIYRPRTSIHMVDMRETTVPLPGQEVVGADGVSVKISLAARYRLADPARAINNVASYTATLYAELQIALREVVGRRPIEELLQQRAAIGTELLERASPRAIDLGIELLSLDVKDLMLPGATRKLFAQVVEARQEGLAALEKARGETAALRGLANAARLVEERPALMQLRLLQQLGRSTGNTVILGMPANSTPVPVRSADREVEPPETPPTPEET